MHVTVHDGHLLKTWGYVGYRLSERRRLSRIMILFRSTTRALGINTQELNTFGLILVSVVRDGCSRMERELGTISDTMRNPQQRVQQSVDYFMTRRDTKEDGAPHNLPRRQRHLTSHYHEASAAKHDGISISNSNEFLGSYSSAIVRAVCTHDATIFPSLEEERTPCLQCRLPGPPEMPPPDH